MHSSPGTPGGWGSPAGSRTYSRVLSIGRPIGTRVTGWSGSAGHSYQETSTVASVGPYRFTSRTADDDRPPSTRANCSTFAGGNASPLQNTVRRLDASL